MADKSFTTHIEQPDLANPAVQQVTGDYNAQDLSFGIVVSRFNNHFTEVLNRRVIQILVECGAAPERIKVVWVPGAYEISLPIQHLANDGGYDALIALGTVIEGETPHAELINSTVCAALSRLSTEHGVPVIDGIMAVHNVEQACERCAADGKDRGRHAALAAIEMARVVKRMKE